MRFATVTAILLLLVGCTTNAVKFQSPIVTPGPVFPVVSAIHDTAVQAIDSLCPPPAPAPIPGDKGFLQGLIDGSPIDKDDVLTVKRDRDLKLLLQLCATPKDQRLEYWYGVLTSRGVTALFDAALQIYKVAK